MNKFAETINFTESGFVMLRTVIKPANNNSSAK